MIFRTLFFALSLILTNSCLVASEQATQFGGAPAKKTYAQALPESSAAAPAEQDGEGDEGDERGYEGDSEWDETDAETAAKESAEKQDTEDPAPAEQLQIHDLSLLERAEDVVRLRTSSHENYVQHHHGKQTLRVALPTADLQRAKFSHYANELVQKATLRQQKNTIVRIQKLLTTASSYNIRLGSEDLGSLVQVTQTQITDARKTLKALQQAQQAQFNALKKAVHRKKDRREEKKS